MTQDAKFPDGRGTRASNWWATFTAPALNCCFYGTATEVEALADERGVVKTIRSLPYPASPQVGPKSSCPPFCYTPAKCQGNSCCRRDYACSE